MRLDRTILLLCATALVAGPGPGAGPHAARAADDDPPPADERPLVVGTGNRLTGRIDALWIGPRGAPFSAALERVAGMAAPRGLTIALTQRETLGTDGPTAPLVAAAWPWPDADADHLVAYARSGRGLLVLIGDVVTIRPRLSGMIERSGPGAQRDVDAASGRALDGARTFHADAAGPARILVVPTNADADGVALAAVRHAIARAGGVRHIPSAFGEVVARIVTPPPHDIGGDLSEDRAGGDGSTIVIDAPTRLDGVVTMDAVTVEGVPVLAPGPLRPIDVRAVTDAEGTVLRLHFVGAGVTDDLRIRLADLVEARIGSVEIEGLSETWTGDPAAFRVVATTHAGTPIRDGMVEAVFHTNVSDARPAPSAGTRATAATDDSGVAFLQFPAAATATAGACEVSVSVRNRWNARTLTAYARIVARPTHAVATDRPVYRPGGRVKGRALAFDAAGRPAAGQRISVTIEDPRGRLLRTFDVVTDDFGAALFEMPLADDAARGKYASRVRQWPDDESGVRTRGLSAYTNFHVEDATEEPFDARIEWTDIARAAHGRVRGAVVVREWDGNGAGDFVARVSVGDGPAQEFRGAGRVAFDIAVPEGTADRARGVVVRASVERAGEISVVTATTQQERSTHVEAPNDVRSGARLVATVRSSHEGAVADVTLVGRVRLLAAGSGLIRDGVAVIELDVPTDAHGSADVVAVVRGHDDVAACPTTISSLDVRVAAPASARPGDDVTTAIHVLDADGRDVPALLDVRGNEAAYAAASATYLASERRRQAARLPTLARTEPTTSADDDAFLARAANAAHPVLVAAARAAAEASTTTFETPWGDRVHAGDLIGSAVVCARAPATESAGLTPGTAPARFTLPIERGGRMRDPAEFLLPNTRRRNDGDRWVWIDGEWLSRHQELDGGWDPAGFAHLCDPENPCSEPGPDGLRIATTALALLEFIGAGESDRSGFYRGTVRDGLAWLRAQQAHDGFVGVRGTPCAVLEHAFATLAFAEAWGLTKSRVLERDTRRSLAALIALQRTDGGFSETGARRGSVIAGTVAMLAVKAAQEAGADVPPDVTERYLAWMNAHADPVLLAPLLGDEEIAAYPFGRSHAERTAAAAAYLVRVRNGQEPKTTPALRTLIDAACRDRPGWLYEEGGLGDPFSVWITSVAAFHAGGDEWRRWNEALQSAILDHQHISPGCVRGSWSDCDGPAGRLLATTLDVLTLETFFRYGRVFGSKDGGDSTPHIRSWFPDLCVSELGLRTDAAGRRDVAFRVPDQITTWHLDVGARDREGRWGRASADIQATRTLSVSVGLPRNLAAGDVVRVPVSVRSALDADAACSVSITRHDGFEIVDAPEATLHVAAGTTATTFATVRVTSAGVRGDDTAVLEVTTGGGGTTDAVARSARVASLGSTHWAATRVTPGDTVRIPVSGPGARATLRVFGSSLGVARTAVEGLLRRPTGCFEQTCATLYPAVLAGRWIGLDEADPRTDFLREGAASLLAFEAAGGGFALWKGGAARADLTALGIDLLLDLGPVVPPDRAVLHNAGEFLLRALPADGPDRILALGALRRLGRREVPPLPDFRRDPYLVGLALTQDLLDGDAARAATADLVAAAHVRADGSATWRSTSPALFSGTVVTEGEVTAVVVEALARVGNNEKLVRAGLESVARGLGPDLAWRTTRETVAALRALLATEATDATGTVTAAVPGRPDVSAELAPSGVEIDLGPWTGADSLTLRHDGKGHPWGVLIVRGAATDAAAVREPATQLTVTWPTGTLRVGDATRVGVRLAAIGDRDVPSPIAVVPIPGGLTVDPRALARAATAAGFDLSEIADGAVRLYATRLAAGGSLVLDIPCVARTVGTFSAGVATSAPYYEPERAVATRAATVEIGPR